MSLFADRRIVLWSGVVAIISYVVGVLPSLVLSPAVEKSMIALMLLLGSWVLFSFLLTGRAGVLRGKFQGVFTFFVAILIVRFVTIARYDIWLVSSRWFWMPLPLVLLSAIVGWWWKQYREKQESGQLIFGIFVLAVSFGDRRFLDGEWWHAVLKGIILAAVLVLFYHLSPFTGGKDSEVTLRYHALRLAVKTLVLVFVLILVYVGFTAGIFYWWWASLYLGLVALIIAAYRQEKVLMVVVGMIGALCVGEVMVRFLYYYGGCPLRITGMDDARAASWHRPNSTGVFRGQVGYPTEFEVPVRWNSLGFNDREIAFPQNTSAKRIVVVGDSYVEAVQVRQEESFYRVAERLLNGANGERIRLYGMGVSGNGACKAYEMLEKYGDIINPHGVIYAFVYNDVRDDYPAWRSAEQEAIRTLPSFLVARNRVSWLYELLVYYLRAQYYQKRFVYRNIPARPEVLSFAASGVLDSDEALEEWAQCLRNIKRWAEQRGSCAFLLELYPGSFDIGATNCQILARAGYLCDPDRPLRVAAQIIPVLRTKEDIMAEAKKKRLTFRYDGHYNAEGHAVIGKFLAEHLEQWLKNDMPNSSCGTSLGAI